jgi:hypothetical protein
MAYHESSLAIAPNEQGAILVRADPARSRPAKA